MKMLAFVGVFWYTVGLEEKHGNEIVIDISLSEQGIAGTGIVVTGVTAVTAI